MNDVPSSPFLFTAGPYAAGRLDVLSFRGREATSRPFRFDIKVAVGLSDVHELEGTLLGQPASLALHVAGGDPRTVWGIVVAVEAQAGFQQGHHTFRLRLVPRFWLLGRRVTSRVFQNKTVPEIVAAVLDGAGVPCRWALVDDYPARLYCVQYEETDLAFVTRLLAEVGIFYVFEHAAEETVVFGDSAHFYEPIAGDPALVYRYEDGSDGMVPREHHVGRFALRRALQPGALLQRAYDFRRPALDLRADARSSVPVAGAAGAEAPSLEAEQLGVYEHHGDDEDPTVDGRSARARLEQHRRAARVAHGESACRRLMPGCRFDLVDHDIGALNQSYALARVEHDGRAPEIVAGRESVYTSTFTCVPADVVLRPKRSRRPVQQVVETAVVVGPEGEEIFTDEHGRVKVQFPWDLAGKRNDFSSCWVRVAQAWAGGGWGAQFVPRVGTEVVVTFVGGDVDRPLITGCVYNGSQRVPYPLPEKKTQSGIKTRSTPGGEGFNEILFDDAKDGEVLRLRAQRTLDESALRDHRVTVGKDQLIAVAGDRRVTVKGNEAVRVDGHQVVTVAGGVALNVAGDSVGACAGSRSARIRGEDSTEVDGGHTLKAAKFSHTLIGHDAEGGGHGFVLVNGNYRVAAAGALVLSATKTITIACGNSSIELGPDQVTISSPKVVLAVTEALTCKGQGNEIAIGEHIQIKGELIEMFSKDASIVMDDDAKINGRKVKLNCDRPKPDEKKDEGAEPEKGTVTFKLAPNFRSDGTAPLTAIIAAPSGEMLEKLVDANNEVHVEGIKGEHFALVDVRCNGRSLSKKPG
jgi:type VI secretion system secreted protein VgrG